MLSLWLETLIGPSSKMSDIKKTFGTKRGNGISNTIILMVKKTIDKNRQTGRAPHINEIKYHIHTLMKYEKYFAELDQRTDEFPRKWGDVYLDLDTIFSN